MLKCGTVFYSDSIHFLVPHTVSAVGREGLVSLSADGIYGHPFVSMA